LTAPAVGTAQSTRPGIDVVSYDAAIEPDIAARSLQGRVSITFQVLQDTGSARFDSGGLIVDAVRENGQPLRFEQRDRSLVIGIEAGTRTHTVVVEYHGSPTRGLLFRADPPQAYTIFGTSEWMPCIDAPSDKATLDLAIAGPAAFPVVGNGELVGTEPLERGRIRTRWRVARPASTYTFGFVLGSFAEASTQSGLVRLRVMGAGLSDDQLEKLLSGTTAAVDFFASRAGVAYPGTTYTTVFAGNGIGQEESGFSVFPESYAADGLRSASTTLGLHELAHQWWGNLVTCLDWTHFWLNEGFATFMSAAYLEQTMGREAYAAQVALWRARYERVRDAGHDRPLVFPDWTRPTADDRTIVYSKGAYVLSLLRDEVGDAAFWRGLRDYTSAFAGKSVVTADFVAAMQASSGRDLTRFANEWIYATKP
jgi:aminopeptidase N